MRLCFHGRDYTDKFRYPDMKKCRFECICACTGLMFFIPLVSVPESRYGRYWANQGILILLVELACLFSGLIIGGILSLLAMIPAVGGFFLVVKKIIGAVLWATVAFYILYPLTFAARCKAKDIPLIGFIRVIR